MTVCPLCFVYFLKARHHQSAMHSGCWAMHSGRRALHSYKISILHGSFDTFWEVASTLRRRNLITHQMFSVHSTPEKFKNATITGHFGFVFEENSVREITRLSWCHCFRKALFSKYFPPTLKWKAGVFKFLRFAERFRKAPFSCRISVDGRPKRRNIFAFSNFSGVVWARPHFRLSPKALDKDDIKLFYPCFP